MSILDQYIHVAPSPQTAIDIFKGEWTSKLPLPDVNAGPLPVFEDPRIEWAIAQIGGVEGKTVLELGPLEGGHTCMLERRGAKSVVAVEANARAYLKCLIVKELLGLERVRFLYGDFLEYLRQTQPKFDVCIASGVLYHMREPTELITQLAHCAKQVYVWTHYYDPTHAKTNPQLQNGVSVKVPEVYAGAQPTLHRYEYQQALTWSGFCGGSSDFCYWVSRQDILACFHHFGMTTTIRSDDLAHPNGPALDFVAQS